MRPAAAGPLPPARARLRAGGVGPAGAGGGAGVGGGGRSVAVMVGGGGARGGGRGDAVGVGESRPAERGAEPAGVERDQGRGLVVLLCLQRVTAFTVIAFARHLIPWPRLSRWAI